MMVNGSGGKRVPVYDVKKENLKEISLYINLLWSCGWMVTYVHWLGFITLKANPALWSVSSFYKVAGMRQPTK